MKSENKETKKKRKPNNAKRLYLILYNFLSAVGWGLVFFLTVKTLVEGKSSVELWSRVRIILNIVQSAACLEVVHSVTGVVRSPFFSTFVQVLSRVVVLWFYLDIFPESRTHWSAFLLFASWGAAEVPRYLTYAAQQIGKVPGFLLWCRYSFFLVLYPTGITGELLQQFRSQWIIRRNNPILCYVLMIITIAVYIYGGPFMYKHMLKQRKKRLGKKIEEKKE